MNINLNAKTGNYNQSAEYNVDSAVSAMTTFEGDVLIRADKGSAVVSPDNAELLGRFLIAAAAKMREEESC